MYIRSNIKKQKQTVLCNCDNECCVASTESHYKIKLIYKFPCADGNFDETRNNYCSPTQNHWN